MTWTLLLVDDERDSLEPMRVLLEEDYHVLTAENGEEALGVLDRETVHMIIADQRMPGMTGVELLTRVKELNPEMVRLVLTAFNDFESMLQAINQGRVYRYIIKPWDVDDMRLTIRQALEWRELRLAKGKLSADLAEAHASLSRRSRELETAHRTIIKQEKLAAVGRFAAEMVHEINNYLQAILGMSAYLSGLKADEIREFEELEVQIKNLSDLAMEIRDFARGATSEFEIERVHPMEPVRDVLRACRHHPDFKERKLRVSGEVFNSWPMDPRQLRHVLLNLLKNATRASRPEQPIEILVQQEDEMLVYRVVDHGSGLPEEMREKVFEPFYSTWDQEGGTGLGLSICHRIMEMHGGHMKFSDTVGGGATISIFFPATATVVKS